MAADAASKQVPVKQIVAGSWEDAVGTLKHLGYGWYFRGQSSAEWPLETAIRRFAINVDPNHAERLVTETFKRQAHDQLAAGTIPVDEIEWLAVIQHFGGPTRLLDWTRSPFVALYFAIADATAPQGTAAVWAVDGEWCRKQAQAVFETEAAIPNDWSERVVRGMYLVPELFQSLILSNRFSTVIPIEPFRRNERLVIQQGLFLCPGNVAVPFVGNMKTSPDDNKARILKLLVPNAQRAHGLSELRR